MKKEPITTRTPAQTLADRAHAGATAMIYKDADEVLARAEVEAGLAACAPVVFKGVNDVDLAAVEEHARGTGTLVICDFLAAYGQSPQYMRAVREVALQTRPDGEPYSRLVLIEQPHVEVPRALADDVEIIEAGAPTVEQLTEELDNFLEAQPDAMDGNGETKYAIATAGAGLARHEYARLLARSVIERGSLDPAWIRREKAERVSVKFGGLLTFENVDAAPVGGYKNLVAWATSRGKAFGSKAARDFGLPVSKGVVLVGVPGGGKTLFARWLAKLWGVPLLRLDFGRVMGSLVGQSESQMRMALSAAEACAPCILLIDEAEKALAGLGGSGSTDSGTTSRTGATYLTWANDNTADVFCVATINNIEGLAANAPETLRKGRFDEIFAIGLPNSNERAEIAAIHLQRRGRDLGDDAPAKIAAATNGFVGAEIEQIIVDGLYEAFDQDRDLTLDDVLKAAKETTPLSKTAPENIARIEKWAKGRARPATVSEPTSIKRRGPALRKEA